MTLIKRMSEKFGLLLWSEILSASSVLSGVKVSSILIRRQGPTTHKIPPPHF